MISWHKERKIDGTRSGKEYIRHAPVLFDSLAFVTFTLRCFSFQVKARDLRVLVSSAASIYLKTLLEERSIF